MWLTTNWPHHLQAVTKGLSFETSDFDVKEGTASVATSSFAGVCTGWEGFGVYVKLRSLFSDRAMSSFSSKPLVGSKLHLSGVCLANASLNFLICHQIELYQLSSNSMLLLIRNLWSDKSTIHIKIQAHELQLIRNLSSQWANKLHKNPSTWISTYILE